MQKKTKSSRRFEQFNHLMDVVAPTLPSSTHVAALALFWRHAKPDGSFSVSTQRVSKVLNISKRWAVEVIDTLEQSGVIKVIQEHQGPLPKRYLITGKTSSLMVKPSSPLKQEKQPGKTPS